MAKLKIYEILQLANSQNTKDEIVQVLLRHQSHGLKQVLQGAFDDAIVWLLPEGVPPFRNMTSREGHSPTDLHRATDSFRYLVKGPGDQVKQPKREKIFLGILESIDPKDADVVIAMKDKKLGELFPKLNKEVVKATWPKLIIS